MQITIGQLIQGFLHDFIQDNYIVVLCNSLSVNFLYYLVRLGVNRFAVSILHLSTLRGPRAHSTGHVENMPVY